MQSLLDSLRKDLDAVAGIRENARKAYLLAEHNLKVSERMYENALHAVNTLEETMRNGKC